MRKLLLRMALTLPIALISQASAMPAANPFLRDAAVSVDLIEVKGGHGHGWGRGHGGYVRLVGAAGARSAGAAMGARPATGRRAGAEAEGLLSQLRNLKYKLVSCGHAKRACVRSSPPQPSAANCV